MLTEHGLKIAPTPTNTYYEHVHRQPTSRERSDALLSDQLRRVHSENYSVYGARKVWLTLDREGIRVARCTVERLMRARLSSSLCKWVVVIGDG